ncbi:transcriptional regulator [Pseudonocardia sp. DSM 110487]|uniref:transcriptional regulator n=1 Tax=Pseudonocardia sp. DSM 110487 TaxID=2865833 RepID=UPI001C69E28E|nr:transcriptional regulator [Pseudonocardia sp. DSM 110487]QYN40606.1 transcriptional regulator [Pseudonocardia sp. DSM 110487]
MMSAARELLDSVRAELAPRDAENRLTPLIADGAAPRSVFAAIAAEELHIVPSDWRSLHTLAARCDTAAARSYFSGLASGEEAALAKLAPLAAAAGLDDDAANAYEPRAGCQAYPAYFAWLALNARPAEVAVALTANFGAWGTYCAAIARGMREHYGFDDDACGFFDFFATPLPDDQAVAVVQAGFDAGTLDRDAARRYARLFQSYELMFWNTLAEPA